MSDLRPKQTAARTLTLAALCEGVAIIAGIVGLALTGNWVWLAIGVIGGLGFTLPALILFVRASMEERDRASR